MQPLICVDLKNMKLRISHGTENKLAWAPSKVIVKARNYETISLWLDLQTISTPGCLLYRVVGSLYDCCLTLKNGIIQTTEFALFFSQSFQLWAELSPSLTHHIAAIRSQSCQEACKEICRTHRPWNEVVLEDGTKSVGSCKGPLLLEFTVDEADVCLC